MNFVGCLQWRKSFWNDARFLKTQVEFSVYAIEERVKFCVLLYTSLRARLPRISFVSGDLLCRIRQKGIIRENNSSRKISGLCGKCYDIGSHILWSSVVAVSNSWKDVFNVSLQISYIIKAYNEVTIVSYLPTIVEMCLENSFIFWPITSFIFE